MSAGTTSRGRCVWVAGQFNEEIARGEHLARPIGPTQPKQGSAGVSGRRYRAGSANSKGNRKQRKKRKSRACMARAPDLRRCRCNQRLRHLLRRAPAVRQLAEQTIDAVHDAASTELPIAALPPVRGTRARPLRCRHRTHADTPRGWAAHLLDDVAGTPRRRSPRARFGRS